MSVFPTSTCVDCRQIYWACSCGNAPIGPIVHHYYDLPEIPQRCKNQYHADCKSDDLRIVSALVCCQRDYHHVGSTCPHCGQKD